MIYLLYGLVAIWVVVGALILWATVPMADGETSGYLLGLAMAVLWPVWLGVGMISAWREQKKIDRARSEVKPIDRQDF